MKVIFKLITSAAVLLMLFSCAHVYAAPVKMTLTYDGKTRVYNAEEIKLNVGGKLAELSLMPPVILEGRTYVPSREVFEPLGAVVDWKDAARQLYIGYNNTLIVLTPGLNTAEVNGIAVPIEAPAKIINNKLMIPARFVAETLGIPVGWDATTRTVSIGAYETPQIYEPQEPVELPVTEIPAIPPSSEPVVAVAGMSVDTSPAPLSEASGAAVEVTGFKAEGAVFTITASGPFTKVDKLLLPENKLVLDMYSATNSLQQTSFPSKDFSGVMNIRNSQFQTVPVKITRVVFDLSGSNRFNVAFGDARKSIIVTFEQNVITEIAHDKLDVGEKITVTGTLTPTLNAFRIFSPERLVFDIPGAKYLPGSTEESMGGRFGDKIRVSQFDAGTVRLVVDLKENPQFKVTYEGNRAVIILTEPTYKNIGYTQQPQPAVILKGFAINPSEITQTDDYLHGRYILSLNADYSAYFGDGEFDINDSAVKSVTIRNEGGRTNIIINQQAIYAYSFENSGEDFVIKPVNPKSLYSTVVYLDAGHGGDDPGASANGFDEKNLNLNIVARLYELLEADPEIKVYASRLDDSYPQNMDRARVANHMADLFVSVHHNAAENSKTGGTEVLYLNHQGEVYPRITSESVARIIQTNLVRAIGTTDRGVVKRPNLIVLNQTTVPAVIVEVIFVSNKDDINKVSSPEGRQLVAESLYSSIKEIFRQYPTGR